MRILATAVAVVLLGMPTLGSCQATANPDAQPVPPTPVSVKRILAARPFTLQNSFTYDWSKTRPQISSGTLVVLEVDRAYVVPRNATASPVLFAGDTPVQPLNHGHLSGRVLGIVPGTMDLGAVPLWFGTPHQENRIAAERASMVPLPAAQLRAARRAPASANDLAALLRTAGADLLLEFSPQDKDLAAIWRLPTAKPPPPKRAD